MFTRGVSCLFVFTGALGIICLLTTPFSSLARPLSDEWEARQIYLENCAGCHGFDRTGFIGVALDPAALGTLSEAAVRSLIRNGVFDTLMPPWDCRLPLEQLRRLSHYLKNVPVETEKEIRAGSDGRLVVAPARPAWWRNQQRIERGRSLFREYCMGCHHPEYEAFAPAYAVVAAKRDLREMLGQIKFPFSSSQILGYGIQAMPKFDLTDPEIKALGAYVYSHRGKAENEKDAEN
jgi:mono/diheme cytochrome c family protein